jgi:hypothetical protein
MQREREPQNSSGPQVWQYPHIESSAMHSPMQQFPRPPSPAAQSTSEGRPAQLGSTQIETLHAPAQVIPEGQSPSF